MQRGLQQVRTKGICRGGDRRGDVGERPADRRTNSKASQVGVVASRKRSQFLRMAGQTATYNLQVTPSNGFAGTVSLSCTGAPMSALCSVSPALRCGQRRQRHGSCRQRVEHVERIGRAIC